MSWLNGVIGQGIASQIGAVGVYSGLTNQAANHQTAQQQAMAQQMAYGMPGTQGMAQGTLNGQPFSPPKWMVNGKWMQFQEFIDTVFPDDTPEKTAFVLKWSE